MGWIPSLGFVGDVVGWVKASWVANGLDVRILGLFSLCWAGSGRPWLIVGLDLANLAVIGWI